MMTTIEEFAARYVAVWNEPDQAVRDAGRGTWGAAPVRARCGSP
jgi:hypothetical protein